MFILNKTNKRGGTMLKRIDRKTGIALAVTGVSLYALSKSFVAYAAKGKEIRDRLRPLDDLIYKEAAKWKLPPDLIRAVIWVESRGKAEAKGYERKLKDYSYGLMQILLATAKEMGFTGGAPDLLKPEVNLHFGCKYLTKQLLRYRGDIPSAIAAYNAGGAYKRYGRFVNQHHVDKVMRAYKALQKYAEQGK